MRDLYPEIDPHQTGMLTVSAVHDVFFEVSGRSDGDPVVVLHGGPGAGSAPQYRRTFDPDHYRIVQFDQRGCGQSTPHAELEGNTTWDLVADIEALRGHLCIERWHVFGGSWGSALVLAYAITHPDRVKILCLRGIFLCRERDIRWLFQEGASRVWPDLWEPFRDHIPGGQRGDMVAAYYWRLTSDDRDVRRQAALRWSAWEGGMLKLLPDPADNTDFADPDFAVALARLECHYFFNNGFFETDDWIIDNIQAIRALPCQIVHGRYDMICPLDNAWDLHRAWPESTLTVVPDAGHSSGEAGIRRHLVRVMDGFRAIP